MYSQQNEKVEGGDLRECKEHQQQSDLLSFLLALVFRMSIEMRPGFDTGHTLS